MTLASLARAGREPAVPCSLRLGGAELIIDAWLRVLPGQRYVGRGVWKGRAVLAKLLVGPRAAKAYARERAGARSIVEAGMPTAPLLDDGWQDGEGGWLLFAFLEQAESLWDAWRRHEAEPCLSPAQRDVLGEALTLVAQMHRQGIWQDDLHLDNLLRTDGRLHVIDGGGVHAERAGAPLSAERAAKNLAVFFAQLPAAVDDHIPRLLEPYRQANPVHALDAQALRAEVRRVRQWRLRDYLKKAGRDCSLFSVERGAQGLRAVRRVDLQRFGALLDDPDALMARAVRLYKDGNTATVACVPHDGQPLLLKRYNIKGLGHWLKRFWRPSRAWHSWIEGQRLGFLGIGTARPIAVRESRCCWLRGRAWLVTEFLEGHDAIAAFEPYLDNAPPEKQLNALEQLFAALVRERISHGDLKGHNLMWTGEHWALIDLDAMRQHRSDTRFARAYARDRARFLRNWPRESALYRLLDARLPKDSLRPEA